MKHQILPDEMLREDHGLTDEEWHAKALRILATQLGFSHDFYFPLHGAALLLEKEKRADKHSAASSIAAVADGRGQG